MACALLTLMAFNHDGAGLAPKLPMALIFSNRDALAVAGSEGQADQNHLASVTFGWTNHSDFQSSIRFTPALNFTN
jgi:hypothetical protein